MRGISFHVDSFKEVRIESLFRGLDTMWLGDFHACVSQALGRDPIHAFVVVVVVIII
jgi:hypothetical protein